MLMSDNVLREALQHAENRAIPLLHWMAQERGIRLNPSNPKKNGTVCDIRIGHEEKNPSLSFRDTPDGAVYKRHGGDDFSGGAVDFVAECLGIERKEAAAELIRRAGLSDRPKNGIAGKSPKEKPKRIQRPIAPPPPSSVFPSKVQTEAVGSLLSADELSQHMSHWEDFDPARHGDVAAHLKRRGLLEAALCGLLVIKVQRGKFAFGIPNPHGQLVTFKARDLKEDAEQRYMYIIPGKGSPAWCSPSLTQKEREIWIEGELNGAALASVLHGTDIGVQGMAGANAKPYTSHFIGRQRVIFIYADPDDAGKKARDEWHKIAIEFGHTVIQLPETTFRLSNDAGIPDACDVLGQLGSEELLERVRMAMLALESAQMLFGDRGYAIEGNSILQLKLDNRSGKWERVILTDFVAIIKEQLKSADANGQTTMEYRLTGRTRQNAPLPHIVVSVPDFVSSSSVLKQQWGSEATVLGRRSNWEHVVGAIELFSKAVGIEKSVVVKHTGWHKDDKLGWVYVTNGSVIGQSGAVTGVNVALPASLERVRLPDPPDGTAEIEACQHSLSLLDLG